MSRSYKSVNKVSCCKISLNGFRNWKHNSTQIRRAKEKAQGFDEDTVHVIKFQKTKGLDDWCGPHDGWNRYFGERVAK